MLNEQKITYRMRTLMESGFFGSKVLLTEAFADNDKVRLFQAAYNYTYDKNLAVDGVKGGQTDAAIADVKKQLGKEKLDDAGAKDFYQKFLTKLDENKASINVGQGGANTNRILNQAIQALINLAGTPLGIDGVIGTKTIAAIKAVAEDSEVINSQNITTITGKAVKNILQLGVDGIATTQGNQAKTPQQIEAESRKSWEKYPCVAKAAGVKEDKQKDGSIAYVDKDNANIYFANGRKMRLSDSVKDDYYCNGMTVTIGTMSDNTKAEGKCESGNCVDGKGKSILQDRTLEGTFVGGKLTGANNTIIYLKDGKQDGRSFVGETKNNKPVNGIFRFTDGSIYNGFFNSAGEMAGVNSRYTNSKGKKWKGNFTASKPVGATWKQLDAVEDDGKETTFPTTAMQSGADDAKKKQAFNEDMKKLVEIIKDYRNQWGYYRVNANSIRFSDSLDKEIFKTSNVFKQLADIPSGRFWMYKPDTKTIFFYEADKNYYVHKIT